MLIRWLWFRCVWDYALLNFSVGQLGGHVAKEEKVKLRLDMIAGVRV